jgi:DNA-binding transcriptional MerR regulator
MTTNIVRTDSATGTTMYICEKCEFKCVRESQYKRHLSTTKHKNRHNELDNTSDEHKEYKCDCGRIYKERSGLWRHKQKCKFQYSSGSDVCEIVTTSVPDTSVPDTDKNINKILQHHTQQTEELKNIIIHQSELHEQQMKENKEMREALQQQQDQHQKQIQELIPKLQQVTTINNTNSNNTTNKFNLNFFLNEQCKDAISIQTFIENLDIGIKELEHMGNVGYLQGMMTIMSNTLGAMDVYKRPVHCTDLKRETVYIKDGDTWKKDNANNDDLRRVINTVANVNYRNLDVWESQHPDAFESDTPDNIEYCRIAMESMGGYDNSDDKIAIKLNKLVKHVVREVYVK